MSSGPPPTELGLFEDIEPGGSHENRLSGPFPTELARLANAFVLTLQQ